MVETHTISAPDELWKQVFEYAKQHNTTSSEVTRWAWKKLFEKNKKYDVIVLLLLLAIFSCLLGLIGVVVL
jgi:hypothetical protein